MHRIPLNAAYFLSSMRLYYCCNSKPKLSHNCSSFASLFLLCCTVTTNWHCYFNFYARKKSLKLKFHISTSKNQLLWLWYANWSFLTPSTWRKMHSILSKTNKNILFFGFLASAAECKNPIDKPTKFKIFEKKDFEEIFYFYCKQKCF